MCASINNYFTKIFKKKKIKDKVDHRRQIVFLEKNI